MISIGSMAFHLLLGAMPLSIYMYPNITSKLHFSFAKAHVTMISAFANHDIRDLMCTRTQIDTILSMIGFVYLFTTMVSESLTYLLCLLAGSYIYLRSTALRESEERPTWILAQKIEVKYQKYFSYILSYKVSDKLERIQDSMTAWIGAVVVCRMIGTRIATFVLVICSIYYTSPLVYIALMMLPSSYVPNTMLEKCKQVNKILNKLRYKCMKGLVKKNRQHVETKPNIPRIFSRDVAPYPGFQDPVTPVSSPVKLEPLSSDPPVTRSRHKLRMNSVAELQTELTEELLPPPPPPSKLTRLVAVQHFSDSSEKSNSEDEDQGHG